MKQVYEDEWLIIKEKEKKPKTMVYSVISKCSDSELGIIHWYPQWRYYTFEPTIEFKTEHSDRCLLALGNFVLKLNNKHKRGEKL